MIKKNRASSEKVGAWSIEDEITILKGLIKLKTEKGKIRLDYVQLYDSIKQSLGHKSATPLHLQKKVKYLREKYKNNLKNSRTPTIPHEEELFYISDKIWGKDDHHIMNQQLTIPSSSLDRNQQFTISSPEESDATFVGDLGLALTTMSRNQSNPLQVALQQFKLVSQSLSIRKSYANQILQAPKEDGLSELEEQKIARSYFDTKIQHAQLVSDAYNASHGFGGSLINIVSACVLKEDTPKVMNEGNCPPATIGCRKPITGKPSDTSLKSVREMCHSQERKKKKKRKIENQEKHRDSSIQSQLEMENQRTVANAKDINECATSSQIHTLPDGLTVEVMVKGKADGKVASPGKQVILFENSDRDGANVMLLNDPFCPDQNSFHCQIKRYRMHSWLNHWCSSSSILSRSLSLYSRTQSLLCYEKVIKGLNIGIEGMHVGEKRRLTIPPSLGPGRKAKPPIMPDSWLLYEVELVDICE